MTVCLIPARLNSSRFPGKLLVKVEGKTVLQRTYEKALDAKKIDAVYIATDNRQIASCATSFGAKIIRTSSDCKNGTERIAQALEITPELKQASIVINLQGDHPCTNPSTLDILTDCLVKDASLNIATAAKPIRRKKDFFSPHIVKCVFDCQLRALYFSRSPIPYSKEPYKAYQHIGIYGYRASFLKRMREMKDTDLQQAEDLEQLKFLELGYKVQVALVEDEALGIDVPEDLLKLKKWLLCQSNIFSSQAALPPLSGKA